MKKEITEQSKIISPNTLKALSDFPKTIYIKPNNNLDWIAIVSKKGENRVEHILRHTIPNGNRRSHGVFNGNPITMVNTAWAHRQLISPSSDGMGGTIYNIPYKNAGYESGWGENRGTLNYITIITRENSLALITAFPSLGDYQNINNYN